MHYDYQHTLERLWEKACGLYRDGNRDASTYFDDAEGGFLASIGMTAQELYDFAEDYVAGGEPDFATLAMIQHERRHYFLEVQKGHASESVVDPSTYPPKDAAVDGIAWLPRIIEKARTKLRGELDPDTMYGCGGDRKFLRTHDIHPAEFLRVVAEKGDDTAGIVGWVQARSCAQVE